MCTIVSVHFVITLSTKYEIKIIKKRLRTSVNNFVQQTPCDVARHLFCYKSNTGLIVSPYFSKWRKFKTPNFTREKEENVLLFEVNFKKQ